MKFKIVLVPFPFDDLASSKVRPAVCLTNAIGPYRHIILAFITSRIPPNLLNSDIVLISSDPDFTQTGLRVSSTLQLHRLLTATTGLIQRELGRISPRIQVEIHRKLRGLFELP